MSDEGSAKIVLKEYQKIQFSEIALVFTQPWEPRKSILLLFKHECFQISDLYKMWTHEKLAYI